MIEAYLEVDDHLYTEETVVRKGLFMLGEKAQSTLRDLQNSSYCALQDVMDTGFELVSVSHLYFTRPES